MRLQGLDKQEESLLCMSWYVKAISKHFTLSFGLRHILISSRLLINLSLSVDKILASHQNMAPPADHVSWLWQYLWFISPLRDCTFCPIQPAPSLPQAILVQVSVLNSIFLCALKLQDCPAHCPVPASAPRSPTSPACRIPTPPVHTHYPLTQKGFQITHFDMYSKSVQMFFSFLRGRSHKSKGFREQT